MHQSLLQSKAQVSDIELKKRQQFLRAQRDMIIARKKKEGEEALKAYEKEQKSSSSSIPQQQIFTQKIGLSPEEAKKEAMRDALARRLKLDMQEIEKNKKNQQTNFASLEDQLKKSEKLRDEKLQKQQSEEANILRQERERQQKLQQLQKNLQA